MWAKQTSSGFTIVELLIVIVVIAVLAAITIVSYTGVQNRSNDTVVQGDLRNYAAKIEAYAVDNGRYPRTATELNSLSVAKSSSSYLNDTQESIV